MPIDYNIINKQNMYYSGACYIINHFYIHIILCIKQYINDLFKNQYFVYKVN